MGVTSMIAVAALGLSACAGSSSNPGTGGSSSSGGTTKASFNAALNAVYNPSTKTGGTLKFADDAQPDSTDPGDTYYGYMWDFIRLYGRSLTMFKVVPGQASSELVGDLAVGKGTSPDSGKTWTYKLRSGLKFEDGTPITSKDVKYAVERQYDKTVFPDGPTYLNDMLNWPAGYKGVYQSKGVNTDSAITTPDDLTITFHLKTAFSGFDYVAMTPQVMPVEQAKDTGAKYKEHPISSGPYMFKEGSYVEGKGYTLVRNPNWSKATDPNRPALVDEIDMQFNQNAEDIDNRIIAGDLDVHVTGTGVTSATQSRVLTTPDLKARADNPTIARLWYVSIPSTVKPFDNKDCRIAVQYAMDRTSYQTAYGGQFTGGQLATTLLPPIIPGYQKFDLYPTPDNKGDVTKAKAALAKCGKPNGFTTNMGYRAERPKEKAVAEAFQQALAKVGITVNLKGYPKKDYFSTYCGNPPYVVKNDLGLCVNGWGADWNDGYGFLAQIVDSRVIRDTGGSSNISVRNPAVDKLLDQAQNELDVTKRNAIWGQIDKLVMEDATVYPGVYANALLLRGKNLTNVFINQQFGYYDYVALGKSS
ncbi:ABC transporter substrate-binding protein [Nostocoides sp. HKS02]|uniref:ABC transporter substrate-binding protein n=1 Tax=Nostocoides sp. HKS02 TaxID=1813880 RepID=UPI001E5179B2|nr:ABC transporter substrate-binding protein [Tetrasphaera sp. HKS02]